MSRPLRILHSGLTYHVVARGNARMRIFRDDVDRVRMLELFEESADLFELSFHAYCEMENHYHAVLTTARPNLSRAVRHINGVYAQWWNTRHDRCGHVFQARFFASIVQDREYLLDACRYVVLNPVAAGMVACPGQWPWSSYQATVGAAEPQRFMDVGRILTQFGDAATADSVAGYEEFVRAGLLRLDTIAFSGKVIRGNREFIRELLAGIDANREVTREQRLQGRPSLSEIFSTAIRRESRDQRVVDAYREFGYTMRQIADFLGIHYSTVSRAVARSSAGGQIVQIA